MADAGKAIEQSGDIQRKTFESNVLTRMGGVLFVVDVELPKTQAKLAEDIRTFLQLDFNEAIDHFKSRGIVNADAFEKMTSVERARSFFVAKTQSESVVAGMKSKLETTLTNGGSLREFQNEFLKSFSEEGDRAGQKAARSYLETVYRTNIGTSYNAGRFQAQTSPAVAELYPYWQYVTAHDGRVRSAHERLHGKLWRVGSEEGQSFYPPNGFNCRCTMIVTDKFNQKSFDKEADSSAIVAEGFFGSPMAEIHREAA